MFPRRQKFGPWRETTTGLRIILVSSYPQRGNRGLREFAARNDRVQTRRAAEANRRGVTEGQTGAIVGHVPVAWHESDDRDRDASVRRGSPSRNALFRCVMCERSLGPAEHDGTRPGTRLPSSFYRSFLLLLSVVVFIGTALWDVHVFWRARGSKWVAFD